MFPAYNPEIIIYAAMKKPVWGKSSGLYTNVKALMQNIAKYKNMFTEITEKQTTSYTVKSFTNKKVEDVKSELEANGIKVVVIGDGDKVTKQSISKGTEIAVGERMILLTNTNNYKMPNIIGYSRKEVETLANLLGIKYKVKEYGFVKSQSIAEGTDIKSDMTLEVELENKFDLKPQEETNEEGDENE